MGSPAPSHLRPLSPSGARPGGSRAAGEGRTPPLPPTPVSQPAGEGGTPFLGEETPARLGRFCPKPGKTPSGLRTLRTRSLAPHSSAQVRSSLDMGLLTDLYPRHTCQKGKLRPVGFQRRTLLSAGVAGRCRGLLWAASPSRWPAQACGCPGPGAWRQPRAQGGLQERGWASPGSGAQAVPPGPRAGRGGRGGPRPRLCARMWAEACVSVGQSGARRAGGDRRQLLPQLLQGSGACPLVGKEL